MEDYIGYIIYGILAILGLISSSKKKKRRNSSEPEPFPLDEEPAVLTRPEPSMEKVFPDFFDKLFDEEKENIIQTPEQTDEIEKEAEIETLIEEPKREGIHKEFNPIYDGETGDDSDEHEFDLEQAVIYTTLLNTKHF